MVLGAVSGVRADPVTPYTDPLFAAQCTFHHFAEGEAPPPGALPDEPLCVEYDKRDITATDGGAIRFLAAEPARFAVAVPKWRYWQQDHWSVQGAPDTTAIVHWDGSYWFDKGNGTGAARLRNFAIGDQPAGPDQAADLIAPLDPDLAMVIRRYGEGAGGGGGATFCLGFREPWCAAAETPLACGGDPGDACAVANARSDADAACDCTTAPTHRQYVACVARVAGRPRLRRRRGELLRRVRRERLLVSRPVGETFAMTRRQLLKAAAAAAAAWRLAPWPVRAPAAFAQVPPGDPSITPTLEAF